MKQRVAKHKVTRFTGLSLIARQLLELEVSPVVVELVCPKTLSILSDLNIEKRVIFISHGLLSN
jgi:hypothetical protein